MKNELITIDNNNLPIIEWKGVRVVTTETLAAGYSATDKMITNNFSRNKNRFVEGKHYFEIKGEELQEIKRLPSLRGVVNKYASQQILWTERGAARHAKILETDPAWSFFEKMEDAYFRPTPYTPEISRKQLAQMVIEAEDRADAFLLENKHLNATVESLEKHLTKGMTLTSFCKALNGVNVNKMMLWASERNWVYNARRNPEKKPKWRVASYARDRYLTEEETTIKTRSMDEIIKFTPVLLEKGCHQLYQLYMKGELPMKKTWNGEYSHDKAIYTVENK
ncbi:TPA: ORF6N domain-containing protein [Proteus mirabilis]|nr:ORF6N domain-containing protein [Proteus mirabilis]